MGALVSFFAGGPARIQAMLIAALAMALTCAALLVYGLWWRGEAKGMKAELTAAVAQGTVLADALGNCNAATDHTKRVGDAAIAAMGGLVAEAKKAHQDRGKTAATLEEIARQTRKAGEGCDWAWEQIEQQKRKARATP